MQILIDVYVCSWTCFFCWDVLGKKTVLFQHTVVAPLSEAVICILLSTLDLNVYLGWGGVASASRRWTLTAVSTNIIQSKSLGNKKKRHIFGAL